jgi:osmotically-inducible protein OsmY
MKRSAILLISYAVLDCSLSGCVVEGLLGAGTAVGTAVVQERSLGDAIDDTVIWSRIKKAFFEQNDGQELFVNIKVKLSEGRVFLTGFVGRPEDRVRAIDIVWKQKGVKEVVSEIRVRGEDGKDYKFGNYAKDSWITTQIRSKLLFDGKIKSVNYTMDTIDGVVYMLGVAQNNAELDRVTNIAASTKGVQKVVSYVRMKDSQIRKEELTKL